MPGTVLANPNDAAPESLSSITPTKSKAIASTLGQAASCEGHSEPPPVDPSTTLRVGKTCSFPRCGDRDCAALCHPTPAKQSVPSAASSFGTPESEQHASQPQMLGDACDTAVAHFGKLSMGLVLPLSTTSASDGASVAESGEGAFVGHTEYCIVVDGVEDAAKIEETKCFSSNNPCAVDLRGKSSVAQSSDVFRESQPSTASTHDSQSNPLKVAITVNRNTESLSDVSPSTSPTTATGVSHNGSSNHLSISVENARMRYDIRRRRARPALSQSFGSLLLGPTTPNVGSTILRSPGSEFPLGGTVSSPATSQVCVGSSAGVSVYPSSPGMSGAFSTGGVSCYMEVLEPLTTLCPHFPERLRIPMSRLRVTLGNQHELGKGQYGVVVQGELYPPGTDVRARKCTSPPPPPPLSDNLSARSSSSVAMYASGGSSHIRPPAASLPPCPIANDVDGVLADLPLHQQPFSAMTASFYNGGVELMSAHSSFFQTAATSSAIVSTPREDKSAASENAQLPSHLDPASVVVRRDAADDAASLPVAKGFQTAGIPSVYDSAERTMSPHSPMWTPRFQLPRPSATVSERCPQHGVELGSTSSCDIPNESESWSSQKLPADEATVAAPLSHVPHPASLCTCSLSASRCSPPPPNQNDVEDDDLDVYGSDVGLNSRAMSNSFRSTEYPSPVYSPGMQSRLRSGDLTPLPGLHLPSHPASIREDDIPPALTPQVDSDFVTPDRPRNRPFYVNVLDFHPMRREVCDALPAKVVDGQIKETSQGSTPLPSVQIASESLSFHTSSNMEDQLGDPVVPPQLTMKSLLTEGSRTKNRCGVAERLRTNCANHKLYNASSASTNTPVETAEVVEHLRLSNLRHGPSTEGDGTAAESVSDSHLRYDQVTQSHECSIPYRHVAVKMYAKTNLSSTNKLREGLCNEVLMASRLSHPCIAHVYGVSEDQEHVYLIIDLADHGTLAEYLQKFGVAHTREMAPRLLADVVLALEYLRDSSAHPFVPQVENQNGPAPAAANVPVADDVLVSPPAWVQDGVVQHKDLKPQNLLLTWDYHVKLSDFGSACFLGDTTANRYGGSIAYLSPEVMLNSKAGPCSDLWALGCILCELMHGEPPFYGETEYRLMAAIQNYAKGKTQLILSDEIPQVARDLIQELLQPVPSKRLGSMERGGFSSLKKHPFFAAIDWDRVLEVNNVTSTNTNFTAELSEYLMEQECAVFCATVSLPPGRRDIALLGTPFEMVSSEQILLLVLTNSPRMFLLNPAVKQTPSEGTTMITFPWVPELSVEVLDRPDHVCITSTAAFGPLYLRDLSQSATQWAAHVELVKSQTVGTKPTVEGLVAAQSMSFSSNSCVLNSLREAVSSSSPQPNPPLGTNSASNYLSSTGTLVSIPSGREKRRPSNSSDALFLRRLRGTAPALRQSPSRMSASARQRGSPATSGCTTPVRSTHCRSAPPDMKSPTPNPCIASPDGESCGALMKRSTSSTFCCSPGTTAAFVNGDSLAASSMLSANARSAITRGVMSPVEGDASIFSGFVLPQPVHNSGNNSSSVTPFSIDFGRTHDESSIAGRQSAERVPDLGRGSTCGGLEDVL